MRALILAAGRGSRMGALADDRPKCLAELQGRPLLNYQLSALALGGASEIGVVRGYRAEMIDRPGLTYFDNPRWAETNMVASLMTAASWLRAGPVIVSYADIFYRAMLVRHLVDAPGGLVISYDIDWLRLWSRRFADPLADAETFRIDGDGRLVEIGGKTTRVEDIQGQYMGLLKFTPTAWEAVEKLLGELDDQTRDRLDMTGLLRRLIDQRRIWIQGIATRGQWGEIDSPEDAALYEEMVGSGELMLTPDMTIDGNKR